MAYYNTCPDCGSNLDPGETCECRTRQQFQTGGTGDCWEDVEVECESEQLKELALFAGEPKAYLYIDSTSGEYFPIRGGRWYNGASAGLFYTHLNNPRSNSCWSFGFRSAYFKKH